VPDEASIIKGVHRIPPAHSFIFNLKSRQLTLQKYWQLKFAADESPDESEWAEVLRTELKAAIRRWTLSDVPIACSLSGGLDSSAIVGLLAEAGYSSTRTYSLGFVGEEEQSWNEIDLARQVAQRWGTDHHEIILAPQDLLSDLAAMVWHLDEPYGGGLPSWYVFREMSRDVKVALTGTGGDELFGNYGKFRIYEASRMLQASLASRRCSDKAAGMLAGLIAPLSKLSNSLPSSWPWSCHALSMSRSGATIMRISSTSRMTASARRCCEPITAICGILHLIFRTFMILAKLAIYGMGWLL
jgi:asparagine synthase (glutamine-hydrolysing)